MLLEADVLTAEVRDGMFYDQTTGAEKPDWTVEMTVIDVDSNEKYDLQIVGGFPLLAQLKEAKRQGEHPDTLRQIADQLRATLPTRYTRAQFQVAKLKGKQVAFLKLVCQFLGVVAAAGQAV